MFHTVDGRPQSLSDALCYFSCRADGLEGDQSKVQLL